MWRNMVPAHNQSWLKPSLHLSLGAAEHLGQQAQCPALLTAHSPWDHAHGPGAVPVLTLTYARGCLPSAGRITTTLSHAERRGLNSGNLVGFSEKAQGWFSKAIRTVKWLTVSNHIFWKCPHPSHPSPLHHHAPPSSTNISQVNMRQAWTVETALPSWALTCVLSHVWPFATPWAVAH